MKRWLALPICLGLAAVAGYVLLMSGPVRPTASRAPAAHSEIRQESKDELREILRQAAREDRYAGSDTRSSKQGSAKDRRPERPRR